MEEREGGGWYLGGVIKRSELLSPSSSHPVFTSILD